MSHRRNNIVLGGVGVRVLRKDEEIERTKVFHHTFGDYCSTAVGMQFFLLQVTLRLSHAIFYSKLRICSTLFCSGSD